MKAWLLENKYYLAAAVAAVAVFMYFSQKEPPASHSRENEIVEAAGDAAEQEPAAKEGEALPEIILVDVKGAVKKPGVYQGEREERVVDIIARAGGLSENADASQVNFAQKIEDEMVVFIPMKGEVDTGSVSASAAGGQKSSKININKADASELQNIPGIGPSKAAAIIDYREKNGPFKEPEQLMEISGIGEKTFEKMKDAVTVR
ncbi:helix-hairpin-helix domain-containing protein [Bacillus sp. B-jedd]|uniref:helix-hairpin-helix domain-containing protein n=1 Tax=Bacillus sp. B-jedd TaxID=1476857 RepID=UPI0005155C21|nr:helix-hairpin-helix domain-containing protein [Bacillus sp. B-jedd]CEG27938.1 competence protein ComEA helix-hairpin-helix repeat-containing protein [Bacillus sp. B-jedd]